MLWFILFVFNIFELLRLRGGFIFKIGYWWHNQWLRHGIGNWGHNQWLRLGWLGPFGNFYRLDISKPLFSKTYNLFIV